MTVSVDTFSEYPDTATIEEVLQAVGKERGYSDEEVASVVKTLDDQRIRTVGNLRILSKDDIKELGLPPVMHRYMLRVKGDKAPSSGAPSCRYSCCLLRMFCAVMSSVWFSFSVVLLMGCMACVDSCLPFGADEARRDARRGSQALGEVAYDGVSLPGRNSIKAG